MEKISLNDHEVFNDIVHSHNQSLNAFAFSIVKDRNIAEDIVQDAFLSLWINRKKIDFATPVNGYLYVITRNLAYSYIRPSKRLDNNIPNSIPSDDVMPYA